MLLGLLCIAFSLSLVDARKEVGVYEIKKGDFSIKLTNWGATVISVMLPDSQGLDFNYVGLFSLIYSQGFHSFIFFFCDAFLYAYAGTLDDVVLGFDTDHTIASYVVRFSHLY